MSSKISGFWPKGHSTSRPYPRTAIRLGLYMRMFPMNRDFSLDTALRLQGDARLEYLDNMLEDHRKRRMIEDHYRVEMHNSVGWEIWDQIMSPWHNKRDVVFRKKMKEYEARYKQAIESII